MRIGSLFSGIGGLELGLERAGVGRVAWQVEIDDYCRKVLAKHWPEVTRHTDVREVGKHNLARVDVLCGGFPCQDVSSAGARRGLGGERSGLWFEYLRIVRELRPRFVVVENVASGKKLWLPQVRQGLESLGYRTSAYALSAFDVGAPHLRRRVFVIATHTQRLELREQSWGERWTCRARETISQQQQQQARHPGLDGDSHGDREPAIAKHGEVALVQGVADGASPWAAPPEFRRVDDGLPVRLDARRLKALGNAVVPQCAEVIGRIIVEKAA